MLQRIKTLNLFSHHIDNNAARNHPLESVKKSYFNCLNPALILCRSLNSLPLIHSVSPFVSPPPSLKHSHVHTLPLSISCPAILSLPRSLSHSLCPFCLSLILSYSLSVSLPLLPLWVFLSLTRSLLPPTCPFLHFCQFSLRQLDQLSANF